MSWFKKFRQKPPASNVFNAYAFGRFSDAFKTPEKYDIWDESIGLFDEGKRFSAYRRFFEYLKNEGGKNVFVTSDQGALQFEIIQGSKSIRGTITSKNIFIQALMASEEEYPDELLLDLLTENYNLKFCKYTLNKKQLLLVSHSLVQVTSPYKLYYTLKEIALTADKKDDLIYSKFGLMNPSSKKMQPRERKLVSYQFITDLLRKVLTIKDVGPIDTKKYPSALRYLLLAAAYKVDFLIKPEGLLMDYLEKIDRLAFSGQSNDPNTINEEILNVFDLILQIPKERMMEELYVTDATFGFNPVIRSAQIRDTIFSELPTLDWYVEQEAFHYAEAIVDFIVGYLLFNFSVPPPCKALFLLYYRIRDPEYFKNIGMVDVSFNISKKFPATVKKEIKKILKQYENSFPYAKAPIELLEYENRPLFYKRYLEMIAEINFTPR